jgi:nudix-type nucleoside diphosphatase (YffH/AdpP family)
MRPLFVFGTLRHAPLLAAVAGGPVAAEPARLPDHIAVQALAAEGTPQPVALLVPRPGAVAEGLLLHPAPDQRARLDAYAALFDHVAGPAEVQTERGPVAADLYRPPPGPGAWRPGPDWDLGVWARDWAELRTRAAAEIMALWPEPGLAVMRSRYPMAEVAAASALRAAAQPAPAALRRRPAAGDLAVRATRRPYTRFFAVQEDDLGFRRFDGSFSSTVTRAGFVMGDAVTVLPWDPVRDRVLLVEQFRYGPFLRGDPNPWSLEPIAGRIDPGESPEAAARREAAEEARLALGRLHLVGRYYPSPGAVTEWLVSYVAEADLPDGSAGLGGLATEAEDIRAHVIPFVRLMELIATGEAANGPLLVSALWLARLRDRRRVGG